MASWIQTYKGNKIDPFNLDPTQVDITDIAHALSMICRFNGHVHTFYSVAQHACHVADILHKKHNDSRIAYIGLLHDNSEYILGDKARPIKQHMPEYMHIERIVMLQLYDVFGVSRKEYDATYTKVKEADNIALVTEAQQLLQHDPIDDWTSHYTVEGDDAEIIPLSSEKAEELFLQRFGKYKGY